MAKTFRCLKCYKIITCNAYDESVLIQHIRTDHPEIQLPEDACTSDAQSQYHEEPNPKAISNTKGNLNRNLNCNPDPDLNIRLEETIQCSEMKPIYSRKYKVMTPVTPRSPRKRRQYRTSIEKWRPANGVLYCPKCGAKKKPLIKQRSEKMAYSSLGAAFILTCWPLCFLPCVFKPASKDYLHCSECHTFLGMYDRERNCVRPNREFLDAMNQEECERKPESHKSESSKKCIDGCGQIRTRPKTAY